MNWQFYDFWGNFLLEIARSQKQMEDMANWMRQGFEALNDMGVLFRNSYGSTMPPHDADQNSPSWQQTVSDFQKAFAQYAGQWGWVSQEEYDQAVEERDQLRQKSEEQKKTIEQLRELLTQKGMGHAELFSHLQDSLNKQSSQFQELMRTIGGADDKK
jgi:uncharacterized protein YdiU (UPF0061 family)